MRDPQAALKCPDTQLTPQSPSQSPGIHYLPHLDGLSNDYYADQDTGFAVDPAKTSGRSEKRSNWTGPRKLGVEDPCMASSIQTFYRTTVNTSFHDHLDSPEPEVAHVLLANAKHSEKSHFVVTDVDLLLKKNI